MQSVDRTAAIVKPKQPFVDWLNSLPDDDHEYRLQELSADNLTFLIPNTDGLAKKHRTLLSDEA